MQCNGGGNREWPKRKRKGFRKCQLKVAKCAAPRYMLIERPRRTEKSEIGRGRVSKRRLDSAMRVEEGPEVEGGEEELG